MPHSHQYTDVQAEAMTADVKLDLSNLATKSKIADVDQKMVEMKAELVKCVVGIRFAQLATILAVPKLFPSAHP